MVWEPTFGRRSSNTANGSVSLDVLLSAYEVESAVLEADLYTFLDEMFARGLLDDNSRPRG